MEAKHLAQTSLDDIIFEGRNKAYGAYQLRRGYPDRIKKAAGISFSGILFFFGMGYAALELKPVPAVGLEPQQKIREVVLQVEPVFEKTAETKAAAVKPAGVTTPLKTATATQAFTEPRIVPEDTPVEVEMPSQADFKHDDPGLVTAAGTAADGTAGLPVTTSGTGEGQAATSDKPFEYVEQMPEYLDGGQAGMMKFISKHLRYPSRAYSDGLEGMVIVSFVVSAAGEVTQVTILKELGAGTGEEAMRVVSKMQRWKPGVQNHRQVPVRMTLPIRFKLNG